MKEIIGEVWENEDMGDSGRNYFEVTDVNRDTLNELLYDYLGKTVRITIEVIE